MADSSLHDGESELLGPDDGSLVRKLARFAALEVRQRGYPDEFSGKVLLSAYLHCASAVKVAQNGTLTDFVGDAIRVFSAFEQMGGDEP